VKYFSLSVSLGTRAYSLDVATKSGDTRFSNNLELAA